MTFKDLKKRIISNSSISNQQQQQTQSFYRLQNKPFWIWNIEEHKLEDIRTKGECCFNHIIGLPTKEGLEKPIFDYQELLYEALLAPDFCNPLKHGFKDKRLWIKKATGLGVTKFFLSFMAWLCLRSNNDYKNSQIWSSLDAILTNLFLGTWTETPLCKSLIIFIFKASLLRSRSLSSRIYQI